MAEGCVGCSKQGARGQDSAGRREAGGYCGRRIWPGRLSCRCFARLGNSPLLLLQLFFLPCTTAFAMLLWSHGSRAPEGPGSRECNSTKQQVGGRQAGPADCMSMFASWCSIQVQDK